METSPLLTTLVIALSAALVGAAVATRLQLSPILGYVMAGIAIGPFTPGPVGNVATVQELADIGVVLLMFAVGLELPLRELLAAGWRALGGGIAQVGVVLAGGLGLGTALGWPPVEALFFGAVAAISSTAVLTKLLAEYGETESAHGRLVLAWGSAQDVLTVLLMLVLSALATGHEGLGRELALAGVKGAAFVVLIVVLGGFVLPRVLSAVHALRSRELFALMVAVVALGTAYGAAFFGLSVALGAFLAGMAVSESDLSHEVAKEIAPLRDLFAGLFFVSVGMLLNPAFIVAHLGLILLGLGLIVVVKGAIVMGLLAAVRVPRPTAVRSGLLLAQSGEFSFLLARLGTERGAVSEDVFSIMLASAVGSIITAPLLYRLVVARELSGQRDEATVASPSA
jgi:CPA2 family monovalent cation:H+ antiporter-2